MRRKNRKKRFIFIVMLALCIMACGKDTQTEEGSGINEDEAVEEVEIGTSMAEEEAAAEAEEKIEQEAEQEQTLPDDVTVAYVSENIEYVDEVIPVQYTDDLSLLADMKYANYTYAYQDGKVYYRRYHEDSYEEAALYGNYGAILGTKKEMVCVDADGTVTELFTDYGDGSIDLVNNRFYLTERRKKENTKYGRTETVRCLYSVDMQGNDRIEYGEGYVRKIDKNRKIIIMELNGESGTYYYTINYETGEKERFLEYPYSGYHYYTKHTDDDNICELWEVSPEGEEREIIALTSDGNQVPYVTEHILKWEVDGDRIYFIFGGYDGQLQVFQGGKLISVKLDGTDYKAVETHSDNYYICHDEGKTLIYFSKYQNGGFGVDTIVEEGALVWDVEEDICYCSEFPVRDLYYYEEMGSLYSVRGYDDELQRRREDVYAIPDDSGRIVRVVMDIEQYITKWVEEEADYIDYGDYYFADGFLYFTVEYNAYDKETSRGWRDGYHRLHTDIYRLKIGEDKAEVLYSY